jgi:alpha-glucosidase
VRGTVDAYEAALPMGGWPNWVLGNHDQHRLATRIGPAQARVATMLLLTLRGTPTCYYGDELGMQDVPIPPERVQDPPAVLQPEIAHIVGRDPERTPMPWDASSNAGFAAPGVSTWLPLAADYPVRNVAVQSQAPDSMLSYFRALAALRQAEPALHVGAYRPVDSGSDDVFAYVRTHGDKAFLVVLNFGDRPRRLDLSAHGPRGEVALATGMDRRGLLDLAVLDLAPDEGLLVRLVHREES